MGECLSLYPASIFTQSYDSFTSWHPFLMRSEIVIADSEDDSNALSPMTPDSKEIIAPSQQSPLEPTETDSIRSSLDPLNTTKEMARQVSDPISSASPHITRKLKRSKTNAVADVRWPIRGLRSVSIHRPVTPTNRRITTRLLFFEQRRQLCAFLCAFLSALSLCALTLHSRPRTYWHCCIQG